MSELPGVQELFERYFLPWHDGERKPTRPRLECFFLTQRGGKPWKKKQQLRADYAGLLKDYLQDTLPGTARASFQSIIHFTSFDEHVLRGIRTYYDAARIKALIDNSDPSDFSNLYLEVIVQFGGALSSLFMQREDYSWLYAHHYFHSVIVHDPTGMAIPIFDWALRAFSAEGIDEDIITQCQDAIALF